MNKHELETLVESGYTQRQIAEHYSKGVTTIVYWLKKHGLKTKRKPSGGRKSARIENNCLYCGRPIPNRGKYCNNGHFCQKMLHTLEKGDRWVKYGESELPANERKTGLLSGWSRTYLFIHYNFRCNRCGWTHYFEDDSLPPLECSHKDNDSSNNKFDNFELLCPNCHAIETRLNPVRKGNGRWSMGMDSRNYNMR